MRSGCGIALLTKEKEREKKIMNQKEKGRRKEQNVERKHMER